MKTCSKCRVAKDESEFSKDTSQKDGLSYRCKSCLREYKQTDAFKASKKAYQQTDAYKASVKAYRQTDDYKDSQKARQQTDAYRASRKQAYQKKKALAAALPGNSVS